MPHLCCYVQAFSSCGARGLLSSCDAWTSHCGGFSCCGAWAVGVPASAVVAQGLRCPTVSSQERGPLVCRDQLMCSPKCIRSRVSASVPVTCFLMCWGPGIVLCFPPRIFCDSVGNTFSCPLRSLAGAGFPEWENVACQGWGCRESGLQPGGGSSLRCGCWSTETQCSPVSSQSSLLSPRPQPPVHSSPWKAPSLHVSASQKLGRCWWSIFSWELWRAEVGFDPLRGETTCVQMQVPTLTRTTVGSFLRCYLWSKSILPKEVLFLFFLKQHCSVISY